MRRFINYAGIALMVLAFAVLTIFVIAPSLMSKLDGTTLIGRVLQASLCRPGEALTASYSRYDTPTSTTRMVRTSCVDGKNNARDVSGQMIQIGAIGYLAPFLIGLFSFMLSRPEDKKGFVAAGDYPRDAR